MHKACNLFMGENERETKEKSHWLQILPDAWFCNEDKCMKMHSFLFLLRNKKFFSFRRVLHSSLTLHSFTWLSIIRVILCSFPSLPSCSSSHCFLTWSLKAWKKDKKTKRTSYDDIIEMETSLACNKIPEEDKEYKMRRHKEKTWEDMRRWEDQRQEDQRREAASCDSASLFLVSLF